MCMSIKRSFNLFVKTSVKSYFEYSRELKTHLPIGWEFQVRKKIKKLSELDPKKISALV